MSVNFLLLCVFLRLVPAASAFELSRWMGAWREIAHIPNRPQAGCAGTTVHYRLDGRGGFELTNTCWKGDSFKEYRGHASPTAAPDVFRARFFFFLRSDYWIVEHDPEYRWAAVGTPDRRQLWIIARDAPLNEAAYSGLVEAARAKGFPVEKLERTRPAAR